MRRWICPILTVIALLAVSCSRNEVVVCQLGEPKGARVVMQEGSPAQIGTLHGRQFGNTIKPLHDQFLQQWIRTDMQRTMAFGIAQNFEQFLRPEHLEELNALAAAAGMDPQQ